MSLKSIPRDFRLIVIHMHFYLQAGNSLIFLKELYLTALHQSNKRNAAYLSIPENVTHPGFMSPEETPRSSKNWPPVTVIVKES
jgi:hypothetical protein